MACLTLVTCAEDPIGPATGRGHLLIIPVFGPYARVAPLTLDQVRIVVERQDSRTETSDTIVDEVLAFDVDRDQLRIDDLTVRMQVASEDLLVTLQLLSNSTLLFQGSQIVRVVRGQSTPQTSIPVSYQGPGANVTSLTLAPRDTVLSPGVTLDYRLDAFDVQGGVVAQYYVSWSLTGGPATGAGINAAGRLTAPSVPDTFFVKVVAPNGVMDSTRAIVGTATAPPAFTWTGAISTDWSVAGNWNPAQVPGPLDSVVIGAVASNRQPSLSTVTVVGAVSLIAGGNLTINGQGLSIVRGLTTGGTGVLTMTNEADAVVMGGNAVFNGGSELNLLTAGAMSIGGTLTQAASTSGDSYHPSGTHVTLLAGAAPTVSFATPGASQFQDLAWVGTGTLTLATPAMAQGTFVVNAGTTSTISSATGARLTVGDLVSVSAVVLNNVPLTLSQTTAGSLTLSNVTFQNMAPTVSQLVVSHPGGTFDFTNLAFSTTPAAPNGFYIDVTDNTGPADGALTINLVNPTPASGGAFIRKTNGAIVNWPSSAARTWTGAVSTDWSDANNWNPAQVPDNTSDVTIPSGTANSPVVTSTCSARTLQVNVLATLNLGAFDCQVEGNVFANGTIVGTTGSVLIAVPAQILGRFPGLILSGPTTAVGTLVISGSLTVTGNAGDLVLGGHRMNISGNFTTQSGAVFTMTSPLDTVELPLGNVNFLGGSTTGKLTAGLLIVGRNFTQSGAATSFAPSGTHRVNFNTGIAHTITFNDPVNSRFQTLDIGANAGSIILASNVTALGQLIAKPLGTAEPVVTTPGAAGTVTLTAGAADLTLITLDKVPLVLTGGAMGTFTTVTFQNQSPTGTQLTVNNTGQATPFVFDQVRFFTTPTTGGLYLRANDLDGATPNPLVINMTNATPASGGALFQATNGAVVNWPAAATRTWSGGTSTAWNVAGNWVGGVVPSAADSAVIPAAANQPVLTANAAVGAVNVTGGTLTLGGHTLAVARTFATSSGGTLTMTNPLDTLAVAGSAVFGGGSTSGLLTAGAITVGGNFTQSAVVNIASFSPSGTHKTVLGAAAARAISISSPGPGATGSHFQVLDVSNATGGLSLDVNMQADSLISNSAAAKLTSAGVALTVRRVDVSGLILDNTRFVLDEQGVFSTENFSNVTFSGFPIPTASTTMLTVLGPGGAAAARPVVKTDNVTFQSMAVGANNFYVSLTSTNGFTFPMVMNGSNQAPRLGGNGPTLTEVNPPTGVATVSWP